MFKIGSLSDTGLIRKINEDSILVEEDINLFIISDGMGGHEKGEVASKIIIDLFKEYFYKDEEEETERSVSNNSENYRMQKYIKDSLNIKLNQVIESSTNQITNYSKRNNILNKIGATVVGLYKDENIDDIAVFHLGDSRLYRIRNYKINQLTVDHSIYESMKQSGKYSQADLNNIPNNTIVKAVGNFQAFDLTINYFKPLKDDVYILCSDGISDLCASEEILNIVVQNIDNLDIIPNLFKSMIYDRGAKDNLSIIVLQKT